MKDKAGRELKAGDFIVYGHALGRCAGLRYGVVLGTNAKDHLTVRGIDTDWEGHAPRLLAKKSTLLFGDRILRVNETQVPKDVLERLCDAYAADYAEAR